MSEPWWKTAVVYQIYPRSFADSGGDGIGDLEGIRRHLDHLVWLGVDALWISPFYVSPMKDFGYDVADYCDVDPLFGTLTDFDRLLADAHARGLRVLVDWVPNHTSDQHPWFVEARASRDAPKRDWYVWRDGTPDRPPNNWRAAFGGGSPAWTWADATRQWYLHLFLPEQPDLDWSNPRVVDAMHDTLRFWLDRGVDGFRMDVIHAIGKDPALPDLPHDRAIIPMAAQNDDPRTHAHVRGLRRLLDSYPGERVMVGEVYLFSMEQIARYYGEGDGLHLAFNFLPLYTAWDADHWRARIVESLDALAPRAAWPTWVLSNHDNPRHHTRYGSEVRARAAAVLLLTLPGTPFLYAGEELGLEDAIVPEHVRVDPGNRDGCRAPIPWDAAPGHGWGAAAEPWLPFPPDAAARNVASMRADPRSILHLYRRLLAARRASSARLGEWAAIDVPNGVLAFRRGDGRDQRVVLVNFGDATVSTPVAGAWLVEVASDGAGEGAPYHGVLAPEQAVLLRSAAGGA